MKTSRHTLLVVVHPDGDSLTHQVAARVKRALSSWGTVEVADLHREDFDPRFSPEDRRHYQASAAGVPPDVAAEQSRVDRATDLVLIFPVYWWSMPAMLKGWVDRVFVNGWAFDIDPVAGVVGKLHALTIHLLPVAASGHGLYDRHGYERSMRNQIEHGLIEFCGGVIGSSTFLHDSEDASAQVRAASVDRAVDAIAAYYAERSDRALAG